MTFPKKFTDEELEDIIYNNCGENPSEKTLLWLINLNLDKFEHYKKNPLYAKKSDNDVILDNYSRLARMARSFINTPRPARQLKFTF